MQATERAAKAQTRLSNAVLLGEVQVRQDIGLAVVDERGELWPFLPQLISHVAQRLAGLSTIRLDELY